MSILKNRLKFLDNISRNSLKNNTTRVHHYIRQAMVVWGCHHPYLVSITAKKMYCQGLTMLIYFITINYEAAILLQILKLLYCCFLNHFILLFCFYLFLFLISPNTPLVTANILFHPQQSKITRLPFEYLRCWCVVPYSASFCLIILFSLHKCLFIPETNKQTNYTTIHYYKYTTYFFVIKHCPTFLFGDRLQVRVMMSAICVHVSERSLLTHSVHSSS